MTTSSAAPTPSAVAVPSNAVHPRSSTRQLRITCRVTPHEELLSCAGVADWVTAVQLRAALAASSSPLPLVLDLRGLVGLDSAGTGTLVVGVGQMLDRGRAVAVAVQDPEIAAVLTQVGLASVVPVRVTVEEARAALG